MTEEKNRRIVVVGAGPAGCALACLLRLRALDVTVFDSGHRPDLIVGESLIPAAIPILQKLGIEERVAHISTLKPGASLFHRNGARTDFKFRKFRGRAPDYAYNIPRPAFDELLKERAIELGVRIVAQRADFTVQPGHVSSADAVGFQSVNSDKMPTLRLDRSSANAAGISPGEEAPLLVDATGRSRLFSRLLKIPSVRGTRNDVAYFAHFQDFKHDDVDSGQIIISILNHGWSWRIPLKEGLSVGVVLDRKLARQFGGNAEERLRNIIESEPLLAINASSARRTSAVKSYSNYQQMTQRGYGPDWAMVGDAFGFVDPMLSPGVFMALESASLLSAAIEKNLTSGDQAAFRRYSDQMNIWHSAWREAIEYLYDGRLLFLAESGKMAKERAGLFSTGFILEWYYRRVIALIISGVGTRSNLHRQTLRRAVTHFIESNDEETENEKYYSVTNT